MDPQTRHAWLVAWGFSVDEVQRWLPVEPDPSLVREYLRLGLSVEVVREFRQAGQRQGYAYVFNGKLMAGAIDAGWSPNGFAALVDAIPFEEQQVPGFAPVWAEQWTQVMPVALADAYLCAGFGLAEAARLHLQGQDPDPDTFAVMAALRA